MKNKKKNVEKYDQQVYISDHNTIIFYLPYKIGVVTNANKRKFLIDTSDHGKFHAKVENYNIRKNTK